MAKEQTSSPTTWPAEPTNFGAAGSRCGPCSETFA